jgi:hypothetical protein
MHTSKTAKSARRRSAAQWKALVRAWKRSGEDAAAFARGRGINARTLMWWQWKLGGPLAARPAHRGGGLRPRPRGQRAGGSMPRLLAVQQVEAQEPESHAWEIETARGDVLRVRAGMARADLEYVLAWLQAPQSQP